MTLVCFRDSTAVKPSSHDGDSPIRPDVDPTPYDHIMLDVDDILLLPSTPLVMPPPVPKTNCEIKTSPLFTMVHGAGISIARACRFSQVFAGEPAVFNRHFFLIIVRTTLIYRERLKLVDSPCRTCQFVTITALTGAATGNTTTK